MSTVIDGSLGITYPDSSNQPAASSPYTLKNRIINGSMQIDQRNAGAAKTVNNDTVTYTVDRFFGQATPSAGVFTVQQSTTAPTGFKNSLLVTVTTADSSLAAGDIYDIGQFIEGFNVSDLNWGTANAQTVTLSFWVRSSVTGTFGGALGNNAFNRSYPFTYTILSANTWEQKTVTITGDTTGTWATDSSIGLRLYFGLGVGSTYSGTAGAWVGAGSVTATGATNIMATNGATFYITGVQLELGSSATPFERRLYNQELANCQRYFETSYDGSALATATTGNAIIWWAQATGSYNNQFAAFKVRKRTSPSTIIYNTFTGATNSIRNLDASTNLNATVVFSTTDYMVGGVNNVSVTQSTGLAFHFSANAEL